MDFDQFIYAHVLEVDDAVKEYAEESEHFGSQGRHLVRQAFRAGFERGYFEAMNTYKAATDENLESVDYAKGEIQRAIDTLEEALSSLDF